MSETTPSKPDAATVAAFDAWAKGLADHEDHPWKQVGLCVYCEQCGVRLYQGDLPDEKRTVPKCAYSEHDWDPEMGQGFYFICMRCGFKEWAE